MQSIHIKNNLFTANDFFYFINNVILKHQKHNSEPVNNSSLENEPETD